MDFIRLALLELTSTMGILPPSDIQIKEQFKIGEVKVKQVRIDPIEPVVIDEHKKGNNIISIFLSARMNVDREGLISMDEDKNIVLSDELLDECHKSIEAVSNLISVSNHCRREIHSFDPTCGFIPDNDQDRELLGSSVGSKRKNIVIHKSSCHFNLDNFNLTFFIDRLDGLSLLSEALSHQHGTGRYHDLIRFFERSFGSTGQNLHKPISQFLSSANLNFSKKEVEKWTVNLRNSITHAHDSKFLVELDVLPFIERMELAAYDILLNKTNWNDCSSERRNIWQPDSAPGGINHEVFAKEIDNSKKFTMFQFDPLGVYGFRSDMRYSCPELYMRFSEEFRIQGKLHVLNDII